MQILIDNSAGDASLPCTSMYMSAQPCFLAVIKNSTDISQSKIYQVKQNRLWCDHQFDPMLLVKSQIDVLLIQCLHVSNEI